jgi:hypothetical protein
MEEEEKKACRRAFSEGGAHPSLFTLYTFVKPFLQSSKKPTYVMTSIVSMFHRSVLIMTELTRKLMNGGPSK